MIDYVLRFATETAARADSVVGAYFANSVWKRDTVLPNPRVQNLQNGAFDPNWFIIISRPTADASLYSHPNCVMVSNWNAPSGSFCGLTYPGQCRISPIFTQRDPIEHDSASLIEGWETKWQDNFASLSLRTGGYYSGNTTGYNDPSAKGTWAPNGLHYMTSQNAYGDFGYGAFINPNYNWQAIDPTFPPLGMIDITASGLVLKGSDQYPLVRASLNQVAGQAPFLSSLVSTTQSMKIGVPYARRVRFTLNSAGAYDFPAVWGLGDRYNGDLSKPHYEVDDFERFGSNYNNNTSSQHTHIHNGTSMIDAGGNYDTGTVLAGGAEIETLVVHQSDYIWMFTNGALTYKNPVPAGADATDLHHVILNMAVGLSWESYPAGSIGSPSITIRSVEILAPSSNTTGIFPAAPPVPVLTWGGSFTGGAIPASTPNGTVVATLSGAAGGYSVLGTTKLAVSGTSLVTVGALSAGTINFYIRGTDASGNPGIAPKLTATIS